MLLYKRKGVFETSIGGICTIISFTMLFYWLVINIIDTFKSPGKFTTTSKVDLIKEENGYFTPLQIPQEKMFTAYRIRQVGSSIPDDEIQNYVVGLWFQQVGSKIVNHYEAIPCSESPDLATSMKQSYFLNQTEPYLCANMNGAT